MDVCALLFLTDLLSLTPLQTSEVWTTRFFLFQPICRLPSVWKVWLRSVSLGEIAGEGRSTRTGPRVGTNSSTFLGHGLADFCAVFTVMYIIRQRCFFEKFPRSAAMLDFAWAGPAKKWHFPQSGPLQISEVWLHVFFQPIWKVRLRSVQRTWRSRYLKCFF